MCSKQLASLPWGQCPCIWLYHMVPKVYLPACFLPQFDFCIFFRWVGEKPPTSTVMIKPKILWVVPDHLDDITNQQTKKWQRIISMYNSRYIFKWLSFRCQWWFTKLPTVLLYDICFGKVSSCPPGGACEAQLFSGFLADVFFVRDFGDAPYECFKTWGTHQIPEKNWMNRFFLRHLTYMLAVSPCHYEIVKYGSVHFLGSGSIIYLLLSL